MTAGQISMQSALQQAQKELEHSPRILESKEVVVGSNTIVLSEGDNTDNGISW